MFSWLVDQQPQRRAGEAGRARVLLTSSVTSDYFHAACWPGYLPQVCFCQHRTTGQSLWFLDLLIFNWCCCICSGSVLSVWGTYEHSAPGDAAGAWGHASGFLESAGSIWGSIRLHLGHVVVQRGSSHGFVPMWLQGHLSTLRLLLAEQPLPMGSPKPNHLVLSSCSVKQGWQTHPNLTRV